VENPCAKHPKNPLEGEWFIVPNFHLKQEQKNPTKNTNSPYQFSTLEWLQTFFGLAMGTGGCLSPRFNNKHQEN